MINRENLCVPSKETFPPFIDMSLPPLFFRVLGTLVNSLLLTWTRAEVARGLGRGLAKGQSIAERFT